MAVRLDSVTKGFFLYVVVPFMFFGVSGEFKVDKRLYVTVLPCNYWNRALATCRSLAASPCLPSIRNQEDYRYVVDKMNLHNITVTWLGLRRQHLGQFLWLDCSPASTVFAEQRWPDTMNCGFLNTRDESLDAGFCATQHGVICETRDCAQCTSLECVRVRGRCFYQTCTPLTWEGGRAYCKSRDSDLANLGNIEEEHLRKTMIPAWKSNPCRFYWVGLRREIWTYPNTTSENVTRVFWARGEPGLIGDCAVMAKKGGRYEWRAVNCQDRHQALCYHHQFKVKTSAGEQIDTSLQTCRTWQTASSTCVSTHADFQLPAITNADDFRSVVKTLNYYNVNVTWLALKKRYLDGFLWLDCKPAPPEFLTQTWNSTTNCAFLNALDDSLNADACSIAKGVICELKGCSDCSVMECIRMGGRCFHRTCTPMTWEAGRAYCRSRGLDLAVLGSTWEGRHTGQNMPSNWRDNPCKKYWVGLRREEWVLPNNAHLQSNSVYWDHDEPRHVGECSIMTRTPGGYRWFVSNCSDMNPAICVKSHRADRTSPRPQSSSNASQTRLWLTTRKTVTRTEKVVEAENRLIYILVPVIALLVIILIVTLIYIIWMRYPKKVMYKVCSLRS